MIYLLLIEFTYYLSKTLQLNALIDSNQNKYQQRSL
jgi:hypothetical protein